MKKFLIVSAGIILIILLLVPWMLILVGRKQLHDFDIPQKAQLIEENDPKLVLAIFPHPDDEVTVSGSLMKLKKEGHKIRLACLTKGEKGNSSGISDEVKLAQIRTDEMQKAAQVIGAERLYLMYYPDGGLKK